MLYIDTPASQVATGWIGGKLIRLKEVSIDVTTKSATIAVQSLDGAPINSSRRILISLDARSLPSPSNKMPFRSEAITGQLQIQAPPNGAVFCLLPSGKVALPVVYQNERYTISLNADRLCHWLMIEQ